MTDDIHFVVLPVSTVHFDYAGLVTVGNGIRARSTERLGPIGSKSLNMLRMETVTERMADYFVGHHPTMPGAGKTAQTLVATRRLEYSAHAFHNDNGCPWQQVAAAGSTAVTQSAPMDGSPKVARLSIHCCANFRIATTLYVIRTQRLRMASRKPGYLGLSGRRAGELLLFDIPPRRFTEEALVFAGELIDTLISNFESGPRRI